MADGFLGRWSRRKLDAKGDKPVLPQAPAAVGPGSVEGRVETQTPEQAPPPTLEDAQALTPESDFSMFTGRNVQPEVSNAAMKKLFADPHYNIMDRMDVYIDDYSRPDPIPPAMLRQLASAKFLGLFDKEEKEEEAQRQAAQALRDVADNPTAQTVAQSDAPATAVPEPADHADPDLRLQQDHAPPGKNPGGGAQ